MEVNIKLLVHVLLMGEVQIGLQVYPHHHPEAYMVQSHLHNCPPPVDLSARYLVLTSAQTPVSLGPFNHFDES